MECVCNNESYLSVVEAEIGWINKELSGTGCCVAQGCPSTRRHKQPEAERDGQIAQKKSEKTDPER